MCNQSFVCLCIRACVSKDFSFFSIKVDLYVHVVNVTSLCSANKCNSAFYLFLKRLTVCNFASHACSTFVARAMKNILTVCC